MAISNESKIALKERLKGINSQIILLDLELTQVQNQKQPFEDRLTKLRDQMQTLRAQKQAIQGDIT